MKVYVNKKELDVDKGTTLIDILKLENRGTTVAIWINDKQVLKKDYNTKTLKDKDKIKIIKPLAGG